MLAGVLATSAAAQGVTFRGDELVAGAGLNLALRGPWVAPAWRRPLPRLLLGQAISLGYERALDWNGWSWRDVAGRLEGYLMVETVLVLVRRRW